MVAVRYIKDHAAFIQQQLLPTARIRVIALMMRLKLLLCTTLCLFIDSTVGNGRSAGTTTIKSSIAQFDPSVAEFLENLNFFDSSFVNPVNWPLEFLDYDDETKTVTIRGAYASPVEVIPSFLTLSQVTVQVTLTVHSGNPLSRSKSNLKVSLAGFEVSGQCIVGNSQFNVTITKDSEGLTIVGSPNPSTVSVASFLGALGETNFLPDGLADSAGLDSFSLQQTAFTAFYSKSTGYAVSLTGFPTINGWASFQLTMLLQRLVGQKSVVTMTAVFPSFPLSSLVNQLTGIDISSIPVIGSLTSPKAGVVISSRKLHPSLLPNEDPLLANIEPFKKGVTLVATFSLLPGSEETTYIIHLNKESVRFDSPTGKFSMNVGQLLQALISNFDPSSVELPPGIPNIFDIDLTDFNYDADSKSITVAMEVAGDISLIPGAVTVSDVSLTIDVTLAKPRKITVFGDASWTIGSTEFQITIEQGEGGKGFVVRASATKLAIGEALSQFGAALLPGELEPILQASGLNTFEIISPTTQLDVRSGVTNMQLYLSGSPQIAGWSGVTLNSVIVKKGSKTIMAAGFDFANTNFAGLLQSLTGLDVSAISLLDQGMKLAVIVSPQSIPDVSLQGDLLSDLPIKRGLSLLGSFKFPDDCSGDLLCEIGKTAVGSGDIRLSASITSVKQFVITAGLADIALGAGLTLNPAALEFQLGIETSIGITAGLTLKNPPIQFQGAIRAGTQGLELEMVMVGVWKRAFGIPYLAFGNLIISTNIVPGVPIPGLQVGGEVRVGDLDSGRELIGKCYVGFDPVNPRRNYYYASINKASIKAILNAFGMSGSVPLPRVLSESGFPDGLSSSFAFDDVEPVPGVLIPAGFKLNGTINIIGYQLSADINLDPPTGLTVDLNMDPINLANGLFKMFRSESERNRGPRFFAKIKTLPIPSVVVKASGYASVLNAIETSAELEISDTEFIMTISGRLFVFDVSLKVYASYGSLQSASFKVSGELSSGLDKIRAEALRIIQNGADSATSAIGDAQQEVDKAQAAFREASKNVESAVEEVKSAQRKFDDAIEVFNDAQRTVNGLCSISSCSQVCIGCPGWDDCCEEIWGSCIGCPGWDSCCTRVPDPTCVTANTACEAIRGTAFAALEAAKQTVDGTKYSLEVAKGSLKAAEAVALESSKTLDAAVFTLEGVKASVKAGSDAAAAISRLTLNGLISIRKVDFNVEIALAATGRFAGSMEAALLGGGYNTFGFNINLQSVDQMARDLANKAFPGITAGRKRRSSFEEISSEIYTTPARDTRMGQQNPPNAKNHMDDVERSLEHERNRHVANRRDIEHKMKKMKDSVSKTDFAPQEAINLTVDDLHLDKLDTHPATRDEACSQAKAMISVLKTVSNIVQSVCTGWKNSSKKYESETSKLGAQLQTSEISTKEDQEMLTDVVNEWKRGGHQYLGRQNDVALRVLLDEVLGREVHRLCGMRLREYLGQVMTALQRPYQVFAQRNSHARHTVGLIETTKPIVHALFDKTIDAASHDVGNLVESLSELQQATEILCS